MRCQVSREHSKIEKWPSVRGYDPWDLEREGIPVDAENRPLWLGVSGQILWKRKWKNGFLLIRTCLSTLILKHFLRKRCLLCFDGSSCLNSGSLYIFHRTLSMMVHTWWCLEHTRTKDHLTKVWIPLWIHMALASILILTQGLNWLSSSVALLELGWARTSCSRKLAHLCSLAVSECTSIQTPIWELEGGLHPCCRPSGVDRGNDSVPDHPPGTFPSPMHENEKLLSCIWLFSTPWTAAYQAPPPKGFSRQEYWSRVPLLSPIEALEYPAILIRHFPSSQF